MNEKNVNVNKSGRIGFGGLLAIVFIVLKLCGVIHWSWFWVLSPIWIGLAIVIILCVVCIILKRHTISEED
jgi:Flp pilus assembly protein TadB